jgi:hypothetical protein
MRGEGCTYIEVDGKLILRCMGIDEGGDEEDGVPASRLSEVLIARRQLHVD